MVGAPATVKNNRIMGWQYIAKSSYNAATLKYIRDY